MNATNDNLHQYVKAYSKLMIEIWHMHELDRVCHFMMGFPTWAKHKLEQDWLASLSETSMKVESFLLVGQGEKFGFKKENNVATLTLGSQPRQGLARVRAKREAHECERM
jgi:hypothetical protein